MDDRLVALFEGDPHGGGLRLLGRSRDPELVQQVADALAAERRGDLAQLERDPDGHARLRPVPDDDGGAAA